MFNLTNLHLKNGLGLYYVHKTFLSPTLIHSMGADKERIQNKTNSFTSTPQFSRITTIYQRILKIEKCLSRQGTNTCIGCSNIK